MKTPLHVIILVLMILTGFAVVNAAQEDVDLLCARAPETIAPGNTEIVEAQIALAGVAQPTGDGWICEPMTEVYPIMGVGVAGANQANNFDIDPEVRSSQPLSSNGPTEWAWFLNAIGEPGTSHYLIVFTYMDDETRSTGYRSINRIPLRLEIKEGGLLATLNRFVDSATAWIAAIAAAVTVLTTAIIGLRRVLPSKPKKNDGDDQEQDQTPG